MARTGCLNVSLLQAQQSGRRKGSRPAGMAAPFKREKSIALYIQRPSQSVVDVQSVGGEGTARNQAVLAAPSRQAQCVHAPRGRVLEGCGRVMPPRRLSGLLVLLLGIPGARA